MAVYDDPKTQYLSKDGTSAAVRSRFTFFDVGTNDPKAIFSDAAFETPISNVQLTNKRGELPSIFYDGLARILREDLAPDGNYVLRWDEPAVEAFGGASTFQQWSSDRTYNAGDIVQGSDGALYQSDVDGNLGNDPTDQPSNFWSLLLGLIPIGPYSETGVAVSVADIDLSTGNEFTKIITADTVFTFSNALTPGVDSFTFELTIVGAFMPTWPASVTKWLGGAEPSLGADTENVFVFKTRDAGTTFTGYFVGVVAAP